ncbi:hypothetical protein ACFL5G_00750 [Candidatus Margulisiibacteriota bacterium]
MRILATLLVIGLLSTACFASLLDTTDLYLGSDPAFGGNLGAYLYNKKAGVEGGINFLNNMEIGKGLLDQIPGYTGSNLTVKDQFSAFYIAYNKPLGNDMWWNIGYSKVRMPMLSVKYKLQALDTAKYDTYLYNDGESFYAACAKNFSRNLLLGAEVALNKSSSTTFQSQNNVQKALLGGISEAENTVASNYFLSYRIGGISILDPKSKLTFDHVILTHYLFDSSGKLLTGAKVDVEGNTVPPAISSVGYIYDLNQNVQLGGSVSMFWPVKFTQVGNVVTNGGPQSETEMYLRGYKTYTLAGEYKVENKYAFADWVKGLVLQGYWNWSDEYAGQFSSDRAGVVGLGGYSANTGLNIQKSLNGQTKIVGGITNLRTLNNNGDKLFGESNLTSFYVSVQHLM